MQAAGGHNRINQNNVVSRLYAKMNLNNLSGTAFEKTQSAILQVYLPPKPTNKKRRYKIKCSSDSASLYSLSYEILEEIKQGYDGQDEMIKTIDELQRNYFYDRQCRNVSKVEVTQKDDDDDDNDLKYDEKNENNNFDNYNTTSSPTMKLAIEDGKEEKRQSKFAIEGESDDPDFYILLYNNRKILRRSHPSRLTWDLVCSFGLFLYAILLPLQFTNVFYNNQSMINALIVSLCIDGIMIFDFIFRFFYYAPHPIKKLDPYYVMIGKYINLNAIDDDDSDNDKKLKKKYRDRLSGKKKNKSETIGDDKKLLYRDLPNKRYDVRPRYEFILEIIAMIPLNLLGIIPSLYSIKNMNIFFRMNKLIYLFILFSNANKSIDKFVAKKQIYFLSARVFRISIFTICILHWMACVWLQFAVAEIDNDKTWLTEMDPKKININKWTENPGYAYLLSLYFVAVTMTTTGYGDITPVTNGEITMTNILIILGDTLMALMAGVFIQYISNINQPSLKIAIKEKSVTKYINHRKQEILKRSKEIVEAQKQYNDDINDNDNNDILYKMNDNDDNNNPYKYAINEDTLKQQKKRFNKLIKKVGRYFQMQLDYQRKVSTIDSLTEHLPLYYRLKLLNTLFKKYFKRYKFLYFDRELYFRLLDNVQEQIYTYWEKDNSFDFLVDPQSLQIRDFMIIQFGKCEVWLTTDWKEYINPHTNDQKKQQIQKKVNIIGQGDLIGFRSLILQNSNKKTKKEKNKERPKYVVRPIPTEKGENFKIVSILRIPDIKWNQIINDVFEGNDDKRDEFEKYVEENIKHDNESKWRNQFHRIKP